MYYNSNEIDGDLKCSICKETLTDVVKLVPDCGEAICECCYDELKSSVDESGSYKCRACTERHKKPQAGLPDVKCLNRILTRKRNEKPLSDDAKLLKSMIGSFEVQIKAIKFFDEREYINHHCDQLEGDVIEEIESLRKQLNEMEKELLKQISEYRELCLDSCSNKSPATQSKDNAPIRSDKIEQELEALSKEMVEFSAKWAEYFSRVDLLVSDKAVASALDEARELGKKMDSLQKELERNALNGQSMTFQANESLFDPQGLLRGVIGLKIKHDSANRSIDLRVQSTPLRTFTGHLEAVEHVLFLSDGKMASCSRDQTIKIWDLLHGTMLFQLNGHNHCVYSLALLSNGWLASGSSANTIKIWDLHKRKEIRTLKGHQDSVVSLNTLKNGNLVSYSLDDTIKIWNPFSSDNNLILTITGHGNTSCCMPFGILSNESLVTCSFERFNETTSTLRMWAPNDGKLIRNVSVKINSVRALLVLSNDQVALGSIYGTIKVIDVFAGTEICSTNNEDYYNSVYSLVQLSNGDLVCCCRKNFQQMINVWQINGDLKLIQSIKTDHSAEIHSLAISSDETFLASAGSDKLIKLWRIASD